MPKGGYREPRWVARITEEIAKERAEREAREALLPPKIGIDPRKIHHPVFNPTVEEMERRKQYTAESIIEARARKQTRSQEQHWQEAIRLIRTGTLLSYADLGQRFQFTAYERQRNGGRECFSAAWAYHLVQKMINRNVITPEEVQRLIPDTSSPFKNRKRKSQQQPSATN